MQEINNNNNKNNNSKFKNTVISMRIWHKGWYFIVWLNFSACLEVVVLFHSFKHKS